MLDSRSQANTGLIKFRDLSDNTFFEVISDADEPPDKKYYFVYINEKTIEPHLRPDQPLSGLFVYRSFVKPHGGMPGYVIVEKVRFGFLGPTFVRPTMPVPITQMTNGARLVFPDPNDRPNGYFRIGKRVSREGRVIFTSR
jgi:hypothetical protein